MNKKIPKKNLAIYFSLPKSLDYPLNKKVFFEAYAELIEYWKRKGVQAVIVRGDSYIKEGMFSHYFIWNKQKNTYEKINKPITVDLIWNRDSENKIPRITDCLILNHPDFDDICRDKFHSYKILSEFSAKTFLINSYQNFKKISPKIKTKKIVLKPRYGEGAYGVHILDQETITAKLYTDWKNIILQEFLDSSNGIDGLVKGLHEINISMINGKFAGARIKQPPKGQLISSATGAVVGKVWGIKRQDIPLALWKKVQKIDKKFSDYPLRLFRVDFVYTVNAEYKLIEINSRPGVMHPDKEGKDFYWDFNGVLADTIINFFKK